MNILEIPFIVEAKTMNILEIPFIVEAKTMGNLRTKNVLYYFSESTHSLSR